MPSRTQPKRNAGALTADRIFNSTSPIVSKDIQAFLSLCILNWSNYSEEEKLAIIEVLPPPHRQKNVDEQGKLLCPITAEFTAHDRILKESVVTFQREVGEGYYTKTWQEKAKKASQERAQGKFDDYLKQNAEDTFGNVEGIDDESEQDSSDVEYGKDQKSKKAGKRKQKRRGKGEADSTRAERIAHDVRTIETGYDDASMDVRMV